MIALRIILMVGGGAVFAMGEGQSCFMMIIGAAINFAGMGMLMTAFLKKIAHRRLLSRSNRH